MSEYPLEIEGREARPVEVVALEVLEGKVLDLLFWWEDCYCFEFDNNRLFLYLYERRIAIWWSAKELAWAVLQRALKYIQDVILHCERIQMGLKDEDKDLIARIAETLNYYKRLQERIPNAIIVIRWKDTKQEIARFNARDLL